MIERSENKSWNKENTFHLVFIQWLHPLNIPFTSFLHLFSMEITLGIKHAQTLKPSSISFYGIVTLSTLRGTKYNDSIWLY